MERSSFFKTQENLYQAKLGDTEECGPSTSDNLKYHAYFTTQTVVQLIIRGTF